MLREALRAARPDIVYLPFFSKSIRTIERQRTAGRGGPRHATDFPLHAYEVWTPLFPNCFVRIDATVDAKRRALSHYQSQLAEADYLHTSLGSMPTAPALCWMVDAASPRLFARFPLPQYLELFSKVRRRRTFGWHRVLSTTRNAIWLTSLPPDGRCAEPAAVRAHLAPLRPGRRGCLFLRFAVATFAFVIAASASRVRMI